MGQRAFSIIELIGVLAILAILTALVLPRFGSRVIRPEVTQTVNEAHITGTTASIQSLQGAVAAHLAQFGSLSSLNGSPFTFGETYDEFGRVLLSEGLIDRPLDLSIGTNSVVRLHKVSGLTAATPVNCLNGAYDLDGDGNNDVVGAAMAVEVAVFGVKEAEARELNNQIDGARLGSKAGESDLSGRVTYLKPGPDGRVDVFIHVLHK